MRERYRYGTKFCKQCYRWISKIDVPRLTYLDIAGGMRCIDCHKRVRHVRKQKLRQQQILLSRI